MPLSPAEKAAGRAFRDRAAAELATRFAADPPTFQVPPVVAIVRHACPGRGGRSTALALREVYQLSPAAGDIPAGRFAFIHRDGRCRHCGATARSATGRVVDAHTRPPLHGRVARAPSR